ncbi:MAG: hypothetical protein KIB00_06185 [Paeniclostridium sordellii]|uniref:hypothetical protein n=1 Tax=Paraclostridium sordellii TaxID=1505 RepID=UPI000C76C9E9|nr:hypothetical protein [Paeniclostridium sordellii]AUN13569.1 hypothetical protein RSJ16_04765 [Paeniclostridium sordellii]MBS6023654.1 hypothetical protein [Paeniclostridium sordellii]
MEAKKNSLFITTISTLVCIAIISHYLLGSNPHVNTFGKIAIVFASLGLCLNLMSVICNIISKKNISKEILTTINFIIFSIVGFITGMLIF